jgi:hypothetical protein
MISCQKANVNCRSLEKTDTLKDLWTFDIGQFNSAQNFRLLLCINNQIADTCCNARLSFLRALREHLCALCEKHSKH